MTKRKLEELFSEKTISELRQEHPWIVDLILVLYPVEQMYALTVVRELEKRRKTHGFNSIKEFRNTVQHYYNANCGGYAAFEKRRKKNPKLKPLFHSPEGKYKGVWAVNRDRALVWLNEPCLSG